MPHWRTLIEKDHLGAWDLVGRDGKPRDFTLKITKVESKLLKTKENPKGKRKAVITFAGAEKSFVSNATNCEAIEGMYGSDVEAWIGKLITLYQADVRNPKGSPPTVKGIKVRPTKPRGQAEPIESRPVDEEMRAQQEAAFAPEREPGEEG